MDIKKILERAKILEQGGPAALAMVKLVDAFESKIESIKGEKGDPGLIGPPGMAGPQGPPGPRGQIGPQGFDGKDAKGEKGATGPPGANGKDGNAGPEGPPGRDGSPDTPNEVVRKVNQASEKIAFSQIKDFVIPTVVDRLPSISLFGNQGGGGARLQVNTDVTESLGQDVRKIVFSGDGRRMADGVVRITTVVVSDTAPTNPEEGDLWVDTS